MAIEKYTAIFYVHGMGQRVRHEDIGYLIEALERRADQIGAETAGILRAFREGIEPARPNGPDVPFTEFKRFATIKGHPKFGGNFRAYEIYWSAITFRGQSPWSMFLWLLKQIGVPIRYSMASWRSAYRLRIARLHRLRESMALRDVVVAALLSSLRKFQGPAGRRESPYATFRDFQAFVTSNIDPKLSHETWNDYLKDWKLCKTPAETRATVLVLQALGVTVASAMWLTVFFEPIFLTWIGHAGRILDLDKAVYFPLLIVGFLVTILLAFSVTRFLSKTASDIRLWSSMKENENNYRIRRAIIDQAKQSIEHVIQDQNCTRVVIVGHSLGSSVAYDALRELGQHNLARQTHHQDQLLPLSKVSHLVTLGSPIDKIAYFFESKDSQHYRANRVRETIRGDLASEPFFRDGDQQIDWINIWDDADIISDPIFSALSSNQSGGRLVGAQIVNFPIASHLFPNPYRAHAQYLRNQNTLDVIYGAVFFSDPWRLVAKDQKSPFLTHRWQRLLRSTAKYGFSILIGSLCFAAGAIILQDVGCDPWGILLLLVSFFVGFLALASVAICAVV